MTGNRPSEKICRTSLDECADLLRHTEVLGRLDDEDLIALVRAGTLRTFGRGETIAGSGDGSLYILVHGAARVYRLSAEGDEITLPTTRAGALLGIQSLDPTCDPRNVVVATAQDTLVLRVAADRFEGLLTERPAIALRVVLPLLSRRITDAYELIEDLALYDITTRLAHKLAELARSSDDHTVWITRAELAHAVGTTPERVSRIMYRLRDLGLVSFVPYGRYIEVHDVGALASWEHGGFRIS